MQIFDRITAIKPHLIGGAIGAVAITIVAFSADWVVVTGTMEREVKQARIAALTLVCARNAQLHWAESGNEPEALKGWSNKDREQLAKQFTPSIDGMKDISDDISDKCDNALRPV